MIMEILIIIFFAIGAFAITFLSITMIQLSFAIQEYNEICNFVQCYICGPLDENVCILGDKKWNYVEFGGVGQTVLWIRISVGITNTSLIYKRTIRNDWRFTIY